MAKVHIRRRLPSDRRSKTPGSDLKLQAAAGVKAFKKCRPDLEDFILDLENKLFAKGVISKDKHDIINDIHGSSIVRRKQLLLDAVESWLRLADSGAQFEVLLDLIREDPAYCIVAERLYEARETYLLPVGRKISSRSWIALPVFTVLIPIMIMTISLYYSRKVESESTNFLKEKYNTSDLLLGPSYYDMPYVDLSIFQYTDHQSWMTKSHKEQVPHNSQPVALDELLNVSTGDRILIIGGPGTGKTKLTLEIMKRWTNNKVLLSCELLFVYRLRWFSLQKEIDLRSIVSMHMEGGPVVDEIVNEASSTHGKKLCFLFDGLDEYEPGYSDVKNYVFLLTHREKLPNAVVIVTTRNITSTGFERIRWTRRYQVTGFSNEQLKMYFQNYSLQFGKNFTSLVTTHKKLWQLCKIPLHVSLLVSTFSNNEIDAAIFTATDLFKAITIKTFESDLAKANEPGKTMIFKDLEQLLLEYPVFTKICALACNGSLNTPRQYSFNDSEVPHELKWTNLSYFQIEPQPGAWNMEVYTIIHPTLMDFLAAVHFTSLNESEQLTIANEKQCRNSNFGYDDFWTFVCGLTNYFKPLFTTLCKCYKFFWLRPLKMAHCIFEAQSHAQSHSALKFAAQYFIQRENEGFLELKLVTLTAYDMQAIGFAASSSPDDLNGLTLLSVTAADEDYDLSFLFYSLSKSKANFSNFQVLLFSHIINTEIKFQQSIIDFFEYTPRLELLQLIDVSWPMVQQLTLLAPPSCDKMIIYNTSLGETTPHSLFKQRRKMDIVRVTNCKLNDEHLLDMRSTPWSIDTELFGLSYNFIGNEGAISLAESIKNLCGSTLCTENYLNVCKLFVLDLKYNNIGGKGLVALLEAAVCSRLAEIDLTGNNITDNDADSIIETCLNLRRLFPIGIRLSKNNLTEAGKTKLHIGVAEKSLCSIHFESVTGDWSGAEFVEYLNDMVTAEEEYIQYIVKNNFTF